MSNQPQNDKPQFFLNPYPSTPCDMFNCAKRAKYLVGRPNSSSLVLPGFLRLCEEDAISVVENLPDELKQYVKPPEGVAQISEDMLDELNAEIETYKACEKDLIAKIIEADKDKEELMAKIAELEAQLKEKGGGANVQTKPANSGNNQSYKRR